MSSIYFIEGNLGDGKTLCSVGRIMHYLYKGRSVATNLDLWPEYMPISKYVRNNWRVLRLPDYPTIEDMRNIGLGYEGDYQPGKEGLIVLDECASWLNSRNWNDKSRLQLIEFFTHLRKLRWDALFLIQSCDGIDNQVRQFLMQHRVHCYSSQHFPVLRLFPKFHFAAVRRVMAKSDVKVTTWYYRGHSLYKSYNTEQSFSPFYNHGLYSYLSPWHLVGRYKPKTDYLSLLLKCLLYSSILITAFFQNKQPEIVAQEWGVYRYG